MIDFFRSIKHRLRKLEQGMTFRREMTRRNTRRIRTNQKLIEGFFKFKYAAGHGRMMHIEPLGCGSD